MGPRYVFLLLILLRAGAASARASVSSVPYSHLSQELLAADDSGSVERCQEAVGWPHLFIQWSSQSKRKAAAFLSYLQAFDGISVLEVHRMHFSEHKSEFAGCHRNFYQNNQCGVMPAYSAVFHNTKRLERDKGLGPFTVILYAFDCAAAARNPAVTDIGAPWKGRYLDFHRLFKRQVRARFAGGGSSYSIHGTQNRLEAMVDIRSLFGPRKYERLQRKARSGKAWDRQVEVHSKASCPQVLDDPCGTLFSEGRTSANHTVITFDGVVTGREPLDGLMEAVVFRTQYLDALQEAGRHMHVSLAGRVHIANTISEDGAVRVPTIVSLERRYDAGVFLNVMKNNPELLQRLMKKKVGNIRCEKWRVDKSISAVSGVLNGMRDLMSHIHD